MAEDIKPSSPHPLGSMKSTLLPIASRNIAFNKGYVLLTVVTAFATIALFAAANAGERQLFGTILAYYITFIQCTIIFFICGRHELWPSMIGVFAFSYVALYMTPLFGSMAGSFRGPQVTTMMNGPNMGALFLGHVIGAGALEELFKALPLLGLALLGLLCKSGSAPAHLRAISLTEPLDGIALGVASGAAFAVVETLYQYYPKAVNLANSWTYGLEVLTTRGISQIGTHMAWAGYFGYFIGLAVLRPKAAPLYLLTGYLTASVFHGANNAVAQQGALQLIVIAVSIAFLVSAILKARRISPTRSHNFATVAFAVPPAAATAVAVAQPPMPVAERPKAATDAPCEDGTRRQAASRAEGKMVLKIGPVTLPLSVGGRIEPRMLGSAGAGRGRAAIAEIVSHGPRLGIKNMGERTWRVRTADGRSSEVGYDQVAPLAEGMVIDFSGIEGTVANA